MPGLTYGLKATISIRLTNYGPCQRVEKLFPREVASLVYDARPKLYGDGRNVRDWIYAGSHCSAAWAILMRDRTDRAYLVSVDGECGDLPVMREPLRSRGCGEQGYSIAVISDIYKRPSSSLGIREANG